MLFDGHEFGIETTARRYRIAQKDNSLTAATKRLSSGDGAAFSERTLRA
jgi:hypothetical protein